ncbi:MAG: penicillin-binding protein 2 [Lachnospiraceae bacterium]|nr:penicillin-binding protein 2 [Lachnospiraceae bacterium]
MARRRRRKRRIRQARIMKRMQGTLVRCFLVVCVLLVILVIRVMAIQAIDGQRYQKIVLSQQGYSSTVIPYKRGDIVDAKGSVLATSVDVYNVILDCKQLNEEQKRRAKSAAKKGLTYNESEGIVSTTAYYLSKVFPKIKEEEVKGYVATDPKCQYKVLLKQVSYKKMNAFKKLMEAEDTEEKIKGIWFEKEYKREYPYPTLASQLIGFTASGNEGVTGLENQYNSVLNGVNGRSYGYQNENNQMENTVAEPKNGKTVVTSIDLMIQNTCMKEVQKYNKKLAKGGKRGSLNTAVLVMNPNNGEIKAMVSYPTFDLTNPRDLSGVYTDKQLLAMNDSEKLDALNGIWQNFPVSFTYEPGSTAKPFTVAMGLETGALKGNESFMCDGGQRFAGNVFVRCESHHGIIDIRHALMYSCNDALMQIGSRIGAKDFSRYQHLFGFGQKTGIDLPGEPRTDSLLYTEEALEKTPVNLGTNAFGQNFNTTMVQLASGFSSLINGGNLYQPHIMTEVRDDAGNVVKQYDPVIEKKTVSAATSKKIRNYLRSVVTGGTGVTAAVKGYDIGGKTGTAEKQPRKKHKYLVSFIGFAPVDDPQLVVYVVVNEPNVKDQAHSTYAQEVAHNILKTILPYCNIEQKSSHKKEK